MLSGSECASGSERVTKAFEVSKACAVVVVVHVILLYTGDHNE